MKINFSVYTTSLTGGNRVIFEVANRLVNKGHEITITSLGKKNHLWVRNNRTKVIYPEAKYLTCFPTKGRVPMREVCNEIISKIKIPYDLDVTRLLAQSVPNNTDINVATYCFTANSVFRSGIGIGFYYIQHFEPVFFLENPYLYKKVLETYYLPLNWIVNSSWANEKLKQETGKRGPLIIPGVDTDVFFPRNIVRKNDDKVIIALGKSGNISGKIKGLNYLFEALKLIKKQHKIGLKLILYGSQPKLAKMSPIRTEYVVNPSDEELAKLYSSSDLMVTSSLFESSPLPPLEAMGCGTPIVTTRFGTEDFCFDEKNSLVVPPQNYTKLADAILRVLKDDELAGKLSEEGLKTSNQLTWEKTANEVEQLFKKSLNKSNKI